MKQTVKLVDTNSLNRAEHEYMMQFLKKSMDLGTMILTILADDSEPFEFRHQVMLKLDQARTYDPVG